MGLLHQADLPLEEVSITFRARPQILRLLIERCEFIGDGWYLSGGTFVSGDASYNVTPNSDSRR
jgi:hypothetical protein